MKSIVIEDKFIAEINGVQVTEREIYIFIKTFLSNIEGRLKRQILDSEVVNKVIKIYDVAWNMREPVIISGGRTIIDYYYLKKEEKIELDLVSEIKDKYIFCMREEELYICNKIKELEKYLNDLILL